MTNKKFPIIEKFGRQVGLTDRAYSRLALYACMQAAKGEIGPEDAGQILEEFNEARRRGAGKARQADPIGAQQVSKFRKVIEAGSYFKRNGVAMVKRTQDLVMHDLQALPQEQLNYVGEYNAVVQVARAALKEGRTLDKEQIKKELVKP